jgi:single-stranded-DNA-specific exonuclease
VAFKLAWALCQRASQSKKVGDRMREFLMQAVGLVSLGTVADVVPLVDENRVLVRHGLTSLRQRPPLGVAALMKVIGMDAKGPLSSEDISFKLAPRLNAAGRLGQATLGIELLTTDSAERAGALAAYLHELNGSRESLERSIYLAANKQATERFDPEGDAALVLADRGWHPGVIGIVAARLSEKFHRPVVLIAFDPLGIKPGVGSARSAGGFNLHAGFAACSEHLLSHGGHAAAAGLKIEEPRLEAFREQFCEYAAAEMSAASRVAELRIDAEVPFSALTSSAVADLERLAPFGNSNPRPLLCTSEVTLSEPPKVVGGGQRHLSLRLVQHGVQFKAIAFGGGEWAGELSETEGPISVAFRPFVNHFRGRKSVELQVCDWQPAAAARKGQPEPTSAAP